MCPNTDMAAARMEIPTGAKWRKVSILVRGHLEIVRIFLERSCRCQRRPRRILRQCPAAPLRMEATSTSSSFSCVKALTSTPKVKCMTITFTPLQQEATLILSSSSSKEGANAQGRTYANALHAAFQSCRFDIAQIVPDHGADVNALQDA